MHGDVRSTKKVISFQSKKRVCMFKFSLEEPMHKNIVKV